MTRFCTYCRLPKPATGFKEVRDRLGRLRNRKCAECSDMRNKPAATRDAVAERRRQDKQADVARRMKEISEARTCVQKKKPLNGDH